ncbi:hypothetical protein Anas_12471 [Armadillidium nasatum]|uniref:DDE-1 domain-containing protein n=1 Tax=Armadillidium nasatum TaxID=96803 RepID=A0A5N5TFE4_9CRUS|nr:hypothetical protein Anas_12471 [Armadillidium nasatum]
MDIIKGISLASQNGWVLSEEIIMEGIRRFCLENPLLMKMLPHSELRKQWTHDFYTQYKNEITLINFVWKLCIIVKKNHLIHCFAVTHAGEFLSPNVIYSESNQCSRKIRGGPLNMKCFMSESGYLDDETFELWLRIQFLPFLYKNKIQLPVILILDGHGSQMTYNLVQMAEALEVTIMCLPPNSANELHPFSLGILKSLRMNWLEIRTTFYQQSKLKEISEFTFPPLLKQLFTKLISNRDSVVNGFAACGLCPFNENIMDEQNSSLNNTFMGNEDVNKQQSGRDFTTDIHHEANNRNLCDDNTLASLKHTKKNKKSCKKTPKPSLKFKRSSQDSKNVKKTKNVQKCKLSRHYKESEKSSQNLSEMLPDNINPPAQVQPEPEESQQKSEHFEQPSFEFIQVDVKPEQKIFSEPEQEIIASLDKLEDFPLKRTHSLYDFKESLQKLEKNYKLKKCFVPLVNIISKKNISSSESSFPAKRNSFQQPLEDFSKNVFSASCEVIKQELDFSGIEEEAFEDFDITTIKEESEIDFLGADAIKVERDVEFVEFPTITPHNLKEDTTPGITSTSTLEENYELNLFPLIENCAHEKHSDTETLVNNHQNFGHSIFLNNWNNETRKQLAKGIHHFITLLSGEGSNEIPILTFWLLLELFPGNES